MLITTEHGHQGGKQTSKQAWLLSHLGYGCRLGRCRETLYGRLNADGTWLQQFGFIAITHQLALEFVTWRIASFTRAYTDHFKVRCLHQFIRNDEDTNLVTLFQTQDGRALLVEQEGGHINGHLAVYLIRVVLKRFFFDEAQDGQGQ